MTLSTAADASPGWLARTAPGLAAEDTFAFPHLGDPREHSCGELRSRTATVTVVVPSWNSSCSLASCLDSITLSTLHRLDPGRLQVVVCDDGSTDGTSEELRRDRRDLNLRVLRLSHEGQSFALNAGIDRAEGDVVVVCDADMILGCGALDEMLARHERWSDVVCFGFRSDLDGRAVAADAGELGEIVHREALSGDTRTTFHMPTIVPNMMQATGWLTRLEGGRHLLDCEGSVWRRHRFMFGCLFSVRRDVLLRAGGMPEVVPRWGYQDTLLAARLEALGAFLLPVATAWGHHVSHELRHADQWFQYDRNRMAYEHLLGQDPADLPWRVSSRRSRLLDDWSTQDGLAASGDPRDVTAGAALLHRLGLWEQCADAPDVEAGVRAECLYRLNRHGELLDAPHDTLWKALALHRDGRAESARCVLGKAADRHRDAAYVLSASPPELRHLAGHYERQQLADIAGLYRDCALLLRT